MFIDACLLIYLNLGEEKAERFFEKLLAQTRLYTDPLVLDETLYISWKKYGVKYRDTIKFLDEAILPYLKILSIGLQEYARAKSLIGILKPSDALHAATMLNNGINTVASEDKDFDKINTIKRIWIS